MSSCSHPSSARQRGMGLVETMLLTVVVGGALSAGALWLQVDVASDRKREQANVLDHADRALVGFAAANYRLPCPDTNGDGHENCSGSASKGSLPWRDLGIEDPELRARIRQLAYMVDRQGTDLTSADDYFTPGKLGTAELRSVDTSGLVGSVGNKNDVRDTPVNIGTTDLCVAIGQSAANSGAQAGGSPVAYGIAHPGHRDMDGNDLLFDGDNADNNQPVMIAPGAGGSERYDDQVIARGHANLSDALNCGSLVLSVEAVSLAVTAVDEVHAQFPAIRESAIIAAVNASVGMAMTTINTIVVTIQLVNAVIEITAAGTALAAAIGTCVVLVGCAEIPHAVAWTIAAGVAVGASAAGIAGNVAAYGLQAAAFGTTLSVAVRADVDTNDLGTEDLNTNDFDTDQIKEALQEAEEKAEQSLEDAREERDDAWEERDNDCQGGTANNNPLDSTMRDIAEEMEDEIGDDSLFDLIEAVKREAKDHLEAQLALEQAIEAYDNAERNDDFDGDDDSGAPEALSDAREEVEAAIDAEIDKLDDQIASTEDDDFKRRLEDQKDELERLKSGGSSIDRQVEEIDASIDSIEDEISTLEEQRNALDEGNSEREQLDNRLDELDNTLSELRNQRNSIKPNQAQLQADIDTAENREQQAQDDFVSAANQAVLGASGTRCTTNDDDEESCDVFIKTLEMRNAISGEITVLGRRDGYYRPAPDGSDSDDGPFSRFEACYVADIKYQEANTVVEEQESVLQIAQDNQYDLDNPSFDGSGTSPTLWDDTTEIMEETDRKGGSR